MARFRRLHWPLVATALLALAVTVGLAACSTPQTSFEPKSDAAQRTHDLYILLTVLASLVGAGVLAALIYALWRFRARPGRVAAQFHDHTGVEIAWTLIPAAILVVITVPSVLATVQADRDPDDDALRITVTGHQWWWEVEYEGLGLDGGTLATANELHVPVGQQVAITLEAEDVIHSFWVPQLVGKLDALPGRTAALEPFTPSEVGVYYGQCTEFCGIAHAMMRFRVIVETLGEFERWASALQTPPAQPAGLAAQGQGLFLSAGCIVCHTIAGTAAQGKIGPDLTRFGSRLTLGAGILENSEENLRDWIYDLRALKPVTDDGGVRFMPSFGTLAADAVPYRGITENEIAAIAAYLLGMRVE